MYLSTDFPQTVSHLSLSSLSMSSSFWLSSCKEVLSFKARPVRLVVSYTECLLPSAFWNSYTRQTEVWGHSTVAQGHTSSCEALREAWCHQILPFVFVTDSSELLRHCWAVNYSTTVTQSSTHSYPALKPLMEEINQTCSVCLLPIFGIVCHEKVDLFKPLKYHVNLFKISWLFIKYGRLNYTGV